MLHSSCCVLGHHWSCCTAAEKYTSGIKHSATYMQFPWQHQTKNCCVKLSSLPESAKSSLHRLCCGEYSAWKSEFTGSTLRYWIQKQHQHPHTLGGVWLARLWSMWISLLVKVQSTKLSVPPLYRLDSMSYNNSE